MTRVPGGDGFAGLGFDTRAIHVGQPPDPATGAVVTPIYQTSTFAHEEVGRHRGYEYSRSANPTRTALEACLASLEGARHGFCFASGMAAEDAILRRVVRAGGHLLIPHDAYGGTYRLLARVLEADFTPVDLSDLAAVEAAWRPQTAMVWVESPTNPLLSIVDIAGVAELAHARGATCVVDNTFATPWLQRPLALGADAVVHSATKYLGGHSDVIGGFVACDDDDLAESVGFVQRAAGAVPSPFDCFLVLRGVKTLGVRMERHCANAERIVDLLAGHAAVVDIRYPGLPSHPGHAVAARQMRAFGAMVSFSVAGGEEAALAVVAATGVFTLAESLGGVESLIEHPARMTHASVVGSPLEVDPGLIRISVGIEDADDLVADLGQALDRLAPA
ncbi:MAG TPA: cystathionine gamma-synthase [Acidimicrobiales bacterium]|nr:cystathionine gamma-synthase [Acidimicrobiales bacterium]